MSIIRSERYAAALLLGAAVLGLILANTAVGPGLIAVKDAELTIPALGLDLSVAHWISDGLLAVFFFIVAVELKHELVVGELNSVGKALLPAIAALGGVIVPAVFYLVVTGGSGLQQGWPVPTATDIAFALGVLAVFGRGIPNRVRVFLLALAVLDDLVAILIIAFFFTHDAAFGFIGLAAMTAVAFGLLSRMLKPRSWFQSQSQSRRRPAWSQRALIAIMILLAMLTWYFTYRSGVHATIAGVTLGLIMSRRAARNTTHVLEPYSNALVLPLFAFAAAMVAIPQVRITALSPAFWGILIGLPLGKLIGITLAGTIGAAVSRRRSSAPTLSFRNVVMVALLGGIGFTVSLLMNELAFARSHEVIDEGTLAVLLGSGLSMVMGAIVVALESGRYRKLAVSAAVPPTSPSPTGPVPDE